MSAADERTKLTVAMIVRNAAEALSESLESIRSIADEIVVLDTGSTDESKAIAQRSGALVFDHEWNDSFSEARNACLQRACGDWVLWLDAGETLTAEDAVSLRAFLDTQAEPVKAYMLLVQVPRAAGEIAGEQKGAVRLVPNHPALRFEGRVAECLLQSLVDHEIGLEALPQRIQRGVREHDPQRKKLRAKRNLQLADLEIAERGPMSHLLNCQGEALAVLGDRRGAAEKHRQALESADPQSTDMLDAYYGLLTALEGQGEARQPQLTLCVEALETFPLDAQLLCAMGGYLQSQGQNQLARRAYQTAWQYGQVNPEVWHLDRLACIAASCYSTILQLAGEDDEARSVLEQTLTDHPQSTRLRRQLIEVHIKQGARAEALAECDRLPEDTPHREALRSAVRGACLASQRNWIAARSYLDAAWQAGCRDLICMRWLVVSLLALGEIDAAKPIVEAWRGVEPGSAEAEQFLSAMGEISTPETKSPSRKFRMDQGGASMPLPPPLPGIAMPQSSEVNDSASK
ncbi:MAG: glycosyltransferase [Pirellulaceae bacterium]